MTFILYNPQKPPHQNSSKTTTSGREISSVHYGFAKYLLEQPLNFSLKQLEAMLNTAHKHLLFAKDWQGEPWLFWIDRDIDKEQRVELRTTIQASIPCGIIKNFSYFE